MPNAKNWRHRPDLVGFEVVELPSIEKRIRLSWDHEYSIPRLIWNEYDQDHMYEHKIRIFKADEYDWRLEVPDILYSDFGPPFLTWQDALNYVCELLKEKQ